MQLDPVHGSVLYDNRANLSPGNRYSGDQLNFAPSVHCNPSRTCPDLEMTIDNWSRVSGVQLAPYRWQFAFELFSGSFVDGGIGEDFMGGQLPLVSRFLCLPVAADETFMPILPPSAAPTLPPTFDADRAWRRRLPQ